MTSFHYALIGMLFGLLCASTSAIPVEENIHADPVVSLFTTSIQTSDEKCDQTTRRETRLYTKNGKCVSSPYCEKKKAKNLCSAIVPAKFGGDGTATVASKECQLTCPLPEEPGDQVESTKHYIYIESDDADDGCTVDLLYGCMEGPASTITSKASKNAGGCRVINKAGACHKIVGDGACPKEFTDRGSTTGFGRFGKCGINWNNTPKAAGTYEYDGLKYTSYRQHWGPSQEVVLAQRRGRSQCKRWSCNKNKKPWSNKCKWKSCNGCSECFATTSATPSSSPSPSPSPSPSWGSSNDVSACTVGPGYPEPVTLGMDHTAGCYAVLDCRFQDPTPQSSRVAPDERNRSTIVLTDTNKPLKLLVRFCDNMRRTGTGVEDMPFPQSTGETSCDPPYRCWKSWAGDGKGELLDGYGKDSIITINGPSTLTLSCQGAYCSYGFIWNFV